MQQALSSAAKAAAARASTLDEAVGAVEALIREVQRVHRDAADLILPLGYYAYLSEGTGFDVFDNDGAWVGWTKDEGAAARKASTRAARNFQYKSYQEQLRLEAERRRARCITPEEEQILLDYA